MYALLTLLCVGLAQIGGAASAADCEYSSREYQVVLRPGILSGSFKTGINQILNELTLIEKANLLDFKVSVSSLKFKNESYTEYIPADNRNPNDFILPLRFKSRQKKANEPSDIVMKTSNADPVLACLPVTIASKYSDQISSKFEIDLFAENGRIIPKTGHSFVASPIIGMGANSAINISEFIVDVASKLTVSGESVIVVPDAVGTVTQQVAEFDIRVRGEKFKATVFLLQRVTGLESKFSFKDKGEPVDWEILLASQKVIAEISRISSIALFAN